jgi:hypothetical protein
VSSTFLVTLGLAVASIFGSRLLLRGLPLPGRAIRLAFVEVGLVGLGLAALAFHCSAMFFTSFTRRLPGSASAIDDIRDLGNVSLVWYAVPALMVLCGLRRLHRGALIAIAASFLAVGVTMYNGGPLNQHLLTIWVGVVLIAAVMATLVRPPTVGSTA